ncbi:unnamed protein product [Dimorphilus gyrociliatus]|uniref:WH1 domain-containing protein n=1 Tax=Dimorphilus gyrociliatus TaxID=2664684 RepID=A0A7I8WDG3_9ANNE|nr:unnamed protein product [Dimorphilus gyrociliatus]
MGEQPIFKVRAFVFQIDPESKKSWVKVSSGEVDVNFYKDVANKAYRIISVEGTKALINSTLTPNMVFNRTSPKFGQWSDSRASTIYGLGFPQDILLEKFQEHFKEIVDLLKNEENIFSTSNDIQNNSKPLPEDKRNSLQNMDSLKYENDRLKLALATSSNNAKKWEVELQTLKNNNVRLTTALQESTANVEEWKKQLEAYKDENAKMKRAQQQNGGGVQVMELKRELTDNVDKIVDLERSNKRKQQEIDELVIKLQGAQKSVSESNKLAEALRNTEHQLDIAKQQIIDLKRQINESRNSQSQQKTKVTTIQEQIRAKIHELSQLNDKMLLE